jgi:hypothetical protein
MTKVSIIIPTTRETLPYCELTVKSLRDSGCHWDIIAVLNGTNEHYPKQMAGARIVINRDKGQCNAVNIGARLSAPDSEYFFISNDDMYYAPGWDKNLRFDHPVFSPNLLEPTTGPGSAPPFLTIDGGFTLDTFDKAIVDEAVDQHVNTKMQTRATTGFNFPVFIKADVWRTIGGYDTKYDPWGSNSDTDLQTKIELAGIQPMRLRDVLVYHFSNKSGTFDGTHQAEWQKNWDYYTSKWGFNRDDEPKPDTWMATNMVNREKNIYHPIWEGRYGQV